MEIIQKKGPVTHTFTLEEERFNFAYKDKTGSGDVDYNYADLPSKHSIRIEENEWLRNVGYLWMILGIGSAIYKYFTQDVLAGSFWAWIGLACVLYAHYTKVKYTVLATEKGSIFLIQDKKHDFLLEELKSRRKNQLKNWYGDINPDNEPEVEINKFKWLYEQGVISKAESEEKITQVELLRTEAYTQSNQTVN